jgi:outer membrane protein OmpA-like peptidoglycan-associated protein
MKNFLVVIFLLCVCHVGAQTEYTIKSIATLNSKYDDIACTRFDAGVIFMTCTENDLVNDYSWNSPPPFHLELARRGNTFSDWTKDGLLFEHEKDDVGPASYNPLDSTLYFSTVKNYGLARGTNLKIYGVKWNGEKWMEPRLLPICVKDADFTHPYFDPARRLLVFSSNMHGGQGGMDIWFMYMLDNSWGEPVNPGMMVNSPANEIFPSVQNGDIIYASNQAGGLGGYDLRRAFGSQQWKSSANLNPPFNSAGDDITLLYLTEEKLILTSNRTGGVGGDDLYLVEQVVPEAEFNKFSAMLECHGQPHDQTQVTIINEFGEVISTQVTDSTGHVDLSLLRYNRNYRIQLGGVDPSIYTDCVMVVYDDNENKIRELRFNINGFADLELLPLSFTELQLLSLEDQSILTINIEGQLFNNQPGDVGRDEPVTILDENGIPVAIAYTNDIGRFRFTKVEPQMEYTFKLSPETSASNVLITDRGDKITLPVLNAEINYTRVQPGEAIELVNEYNEKIFVSPRDLFVINRIYYEYNSAKLTGEALSQLDQIGIIMKRNDQIGIELRSHTDSRGNDDYNLKLSERRAESAVKYLMSRGISARRFKAVGLGETALLNECDDGVECSDPEHSINRRSEIKLIRMPEVR